MKRILLFFALSVILFSAKAQLPAGIGGQVNWWSVTDALRLGAPPIGTTSDTMVLLRRNSDSVVTVMSITNFRAYLNSGFMQYTDTAGMLVSYLRKSDTSNMLNHYLLKDGSNENTDLNIGTHNIKAAGGTIEQQLFPQLYFLRDSYNGTAGIITGNAANTNPWLTGSYGGTSHWVVYNNLRKALDVDSATGKLVTYQDDYIANFGSLFGARSKPDVNWVDSMLALVIGGDTTSLSNRINLKLNIGDTSTMLSSYRRTTTAIINSDITSLAWSKITSTPTTKSGYGITDVVSYSDTSAMLSNYRRKTTLITNSDLASNTISGVLLGTNLANLSAGNSSLLLSGTGHYNGNNIVGITLNVANSNSWSAAQYFPEFSGVNSATQAEFDLNGGAGSYGGTLLFEANGTVHGSLYSSVGGNLFLATGTSLLTAIQMDNSQNVYVPKLTVKGLVTNTYAGQLGTVTGTGFVKDNGSGVISYDNSTYLSTSTAASTYLKLDASNGPLTGPLVSNSTITGGAASFTTGAFTDKVTIQGHANDYSTIITGNSTTGQSYGLSVRGGTNSSDLALVVANQSNSKNFYLIDGLGNHNFGTGTATFGNNVSISSLDSNFGLIVTGVSTASASYGARVSAGTNTADAAFQVTDYANSVNYFKVRGDGVSIFGGNVGIGATPQVKFQTHVNTDQNLGIRDVGGITQLLSHNDALTGYKPLLIDGTIIKLNPSTGGAVTMPNYYTTSSTPAVALQGAAGIGATYSIVGTNMDGVLTITTGTSLSVSSGNLAVLTFSGSFAFPNGCAPQVDYGASFAATSVYAYGSTTTITIGTPVALAGLTTYTINYHVGGY